MSLPVALVAALARNGAIGFENALPWRVSSDLKRFRAVTWGKPLVMGRKTFQSIGKPLQGRETVIVTRDRAFAAPEGAHVTHDLDEALAIADELGRAMGASEIILAGGAQLYALALARAQRMYLTRIDSAPQADAFFPPVEWSDWIETRRDAPGRGPKDDADFAFIDYERKPADINP